MDDAHQPNTGRSTQYVVRLYTFRGGKIVRGRNYYDTGIYVRAVRGQSLTHLGVYGTRRLRRA